MMIDRVFLDMDGVLVDFVGGALKAHGRPPDFPLTPGEWHIHKPLGLSERAFWAPLVGAHFWASLRTMNDARVILCQIEMAFDMQQIYLATSPSHDPWCAAGKAMWVQDRFPEYRDRLIVGSHKHLLAGPGALLIDDSDANCEKFQAHGGAAILLPRRWNSRHLDSGADLGEWLGAELEGLVRQSAPQPVKAAAAAAQSLFARQVVHELARVRQGHSPLNSAHEAYSVLLEEVDEFWGEVKLKRELRSEEKMYGELIQIGAVAQRAAEDLGLVDPRPSVVASVVGGGPGRMTRREPR